MNNSKVWMMFVICREKSAWLVRASFANLKSIVATTFLFKPLKSYDLMFKVMQYWEQHVSGTLRGLQILNIEFIIVRQRKILSNICLHASKLEIVFAAFEQYAISPRCTLVFWNAFSVNFMSHNTIVYVTEASTFETQYVGF